MKGELKISSWYGLGHYLLANYVIKFLEKYPELKINIIGNNGFSTDFDYYKSDACVLPFLDEGDDLIQIKIYSTSFCAYASKSYLKEYGVPRNFSDLDHHLLLAANTKT